VRRNILITGASSGLGAEMARQFAAKGHNLALCGRRVDRLDELRASLLDRYPGVTVSVKALDVISSLTGVRGFPGSATKAGMSALAKGIRADVLATPTEVITILPGYIQTEITSKAKRPFIVSAERGVRSIVNSVEREVAVAAAPRWPWSALGVVMRVIPLRWFIKFTG
jgi:short-subunit dehydrogenase